MANINISSQGSGIRPMADISAKNIGTPAGQLKTAGANIASSVRSVTQNVGQAKAESASTDNAGKINIKV